MGAKGEVGLWSTREGASVDEVDGVDGVEGMEDVLGGIGDGEAGKEEATTVRWFEVEGSGVDCGDKELEGKAEG